tara:strand:- start:184 stop:1080 length:897 start_codon:yes stop_codon:yes gene_type:complete
MDINDTYNCLTYYNGYFKKPPIIDINNIRYYSVIEIYDIIKFWSDSELDTIQDSIVYLRLEIDGYNKRILLKACMIEEIIHKNSLFKCSNINSQHSLNMTYYNVLNEVIETIKYSKKIVESSTGKLSKKRKVSKTEMINIFCKTTESNECNIENIKNNIIYSDNLLPLIELIPNCDSTLKCNLELHYTKMSIYEELLFQSINDDKFNCVNSKMLKNLETLNDQISSYNYPNYIIHNNEPLKEPFNCLVCSDGCTEHADCMYSNCRHMCVCYNCSKKLDKMECMICRQHNDCLIQVFKP